MYCVAAVLDYLLLSSRSKKPAIVPSLVALFMSFVLFSPLFWKRKKGGLIAGYRLKGSENSFDGGLNFAWTGQESFFVVLVSCYRLEVMRIWTAGFPSDQQAPNFLQKMFRMNLPLKDCFFSTTGILAFYGDKGIIGYKEKLSAR